MNIQLQTLEQTRNFGISLGRTARPGDIICLSGDLGAGKTTLTQAIGEGLAVRKENYITSPTFAIMQDYDGRIPLYHMDFYRLSDSSEVEDLGFEEYFFGNGLTVIEWPDIALDLLPETRLYLEITIVDEKSRRMKCDFGTSDWQKRLQDVIQQLSV